MSLRLGPLIVCTCVALYRAVWISLQLSDLDVSEVGFLLLSDLPVLGALGLLAYGESVLPRVWKVVPLALAIGLMIVYLVDVFAVLALNSRLQLSDIRRFAAELWVAPSFVSVLSGAVLLAAALSFFLSLRVPHSAVRFMVTTSVSLLLIPFLISDEGIPSHLRKYVDSVLLLPVDWGGRRLPATQYKPGDVATYRDEYDKLFEAPIAQTKRNIVLVIVESLSAVDSERTAGITNYLPRFDELSREGMLFRNFLANYEASEGGIVALLSGVPPLHFPTASTNTFAEYRVQRSMIESFRRSGYDCEFLTTVPLHFLSMNAYVRAPRIGFTHAGGQREIERFKGAPRFAFESPADHVLYEEVLDRLDSRPRDSREPVFLTAVTASSHMPYVDPRGQLNVEQNVWAYVEDELWWLYKELDKRAFFENGYLIVTGDHRRMRPVRQAERIRFGDSAKARIPLVVIGPGVPKDTVDDRLFQQSDLLRMLDRAVRPGVELSPFVLWVERYLFFHGVASNAANLEVFVSSNQAREGFRLNLRGAEIEWLKPPPDPLVVERAIHRQRAIQQATRAATISSRMLAFGRDIEPSEHARGILIGVSADVDVSRDPDDPRGSLRLLTSGSVDLYRVLPLSGEDVPHTLTARAFLRIPADGEYWFSAFGDSEVCLFIDKQVVLGCQAGLNQGAAWLTSGAHRLDLRLVARNRTHRFELNWLPPGAKAFVPLPQESLILPAVRH